MDITVCIGSSCHLRGSREIIEKLQRLVAEYNLEEKVNLCGSFCMGNCQDGVCVGLDDKIFSLTPDTAEEFFLNEVLRRISQ